MHAFSFFLWHDDVFFPTARFLCHLNARRYNEMEPRSNSTEYLGNSTLFVFSTMRKADPEAVWVMQGWMFLSEPWFWGQPQVRLSVVVFM